MDRRSYLAVAGVGALAGCLDRVGFGDDGGEEPAFERTAEALTARELARAISRLNEVALALGLVADRFEEPEAFEFDADEHRERLETARSHLAEVDDERAADREELWTYADGLAGTLDGVEGVDDGEFGDDEALESAFEERRLEETRERLDRRRSGLAEPLDRVDPARETLAGLDRDRLDGLNAVDVEPIEEGATRLTEVLGAGLELTDAYGLTVDGYEGVEEGEAAVDAGELEPARGSFADARATFADASAALDGLDPAGVDSIEEGARELSSVLDPSKTVLDAQVTTIDGFERLEEGEGHLEEEAFGPAGDAFADARATFADAEATLDGMDEEEAEPVEAERSRLREVVGAGAGLAEANGTATEGFTHLEEGGEHVDDESLGPARESFAAARRSFTESGRTLEGVDPAGVDPLEDGTAELEDVLEASVTLTDANDATVAGLQRIDAGEDANEAGAFEDARVEFLAAREAFADATATLEAADAPPDRLEDRFDRARCRSDTLEEGAETFVEAMDAAIDGRPREADALETEARRRVEEAEDCG